ncbi:MAG: hypothetical protein WKF96_16995 [Solirubrobacteraceae bacterium]
MGGREVHLGGEPDGVADLGVLDAREQQFGDLELAPECRPIALRDRLASKAVAPSATTSPIGMSEAMTFHVAVERSRWRLSQ